MADSSSTTIHIAVEIPDSIISEHLPTRQWFEKQVASQLKDFILEKYEMFYTHPELFYIPFEVLNDD